MSTCADICQHADKIQLIGIIWAKNDVAFRHMSAHVSTCRHISAHVGMSICADTWQHADKVQMVGSRGAESDASVIC